MFRRSFSLLGAASSIWEADDTTKTYVTGLSALTYDYDLEAVAMLRATEISTRFSHTRPDGSKWSTAFPSGNYYKGENIGGAGLEAHRNLELMGMSKDFSRLGPISQLLQADKGNDLV